MSSSNEDNFNDRIEMIKDNAGIIGRNFVGGSWFYWLFLGGLYLYNYISFVIGFAINFPGSTHLYASFWWTVVTITEGLLAWYLSLKLGWGYMNKFVRAHLSFVEREELNMRLRRAGVFAAIGVVMLVLDLLNGAAFGTTMLGKDFSYAGLSVDPAGWLGKWALRYSIVNVLFNIIGSLGQEWLAFFKHDLSLITGYIYGGALMNEAQRAAIKLEGLLKDRNIPLSAETLVNYGFRYNWEAQFEEGTIPPNNPLYKYADQLREIGVIYIGGPKRRTVPQSTMEPQPA